jgi:dephospho-CoA kinase
MKKLGLTGGIASGKTAVAKMLRDLGFDVLDADSLARELIEPGRAAYDEVVREFGPGIIASNRPGNHIDRKILGAIVFSDRAKLDRLNAIVHPRVREIILQQLDELARGGDRAAAFVEAALLVEAHYQDYLDALVVVWCLPEQQLERLVARGLGEQDARNRIASQLPVAEKLKLATEKIDCSGSLEDTRKQVEALAAKLRRRA